MTSTKKEKLKKKQTWHENLQALIYFAPATVCPKKKIRRQLRLNKEGKSKERLKS